YFTWTLQPCRRLYLESQRRSLCKLDELRPAFSRPGSIPRTVSRLQFRCIATPSIQKRASVSSRRVFPGCRFSPRACLASLKPTRLKREERSISNEAIGGRRSQLGRSLKAKWGKSRPSDSNPLSRSRTMTISKRVRALRCSIHQARYRYHSNGPSPSALVSFT